MTTQRCLRWKLVLRLLLVVIIPWPWIALANGDREVMRDQVANAKGFIAALDQSGGSTPKALDAYGVPRETYTIGDDSMFDTVHEMRARIMTSPAFAPPDVFATILFEDTMNRNVNGLPVAEFLWERKGIVPFLKIDKGLMEQMDGVQMMRPMPDLSKLLHRAQKKGIFGTKMRSIIHEDNSTGIHKIVEQQFEIGRTVASFGLVPIIEPEVNIHSPSKQECEELLKKELLDHLNQLDEDECVILKVSLPNESDFYRECIEHPRCLRVVALSGGYSRSEATRRLQKQPLMVASFSRAFTEGLQYEMTGKKFDRTLNQSIQEICASTVTID